MENMVILSSPLWNGVPVFITGHTGFKGSWLSFWLQELGAKVHGYALDPLGGANLFDTLRLSEKVESDTRANLKDIAHLRAALNIAQPRVVFHLAAQAFVNEGYINPIETFETNVLGTVNLLEALRELQCVKAVVIVTSDKVYQVTESAHRHQESDPLGGEDPYSASKAAAEMVSACYRSSYFQQSTTQNSVRIATARAGNVIGGGDWSPNRLVPDCLSAFRNGSPVKLRFPTAIRPWQHVIEALSGYLLLAEKLMASTSEEYSRAWNFGPAESSDATVAEIAEKLATLWGTGASIEYDKGTARIKEVQQLRLDASLANRKLGWQPRRNLDMALRETVEWYKGWVNNSDMEVLTRLQIQRYCYLGRFGDN